MPDGLNILLRVILGIIDFTISILHTFSPRFREVYHDIAVVISVLLLAGCLGFVLYTKGHVYPFWIIGAGVTGVVLSLYSRWSYDTPGIDVGNLNDDNIKQYTKSGKGRYDY